MWTQCLLLWLHAKTRVFEVCFQYLKKGIFVLFRFITASVLYIVRIELYVSWRKGPAWLITRLLLNQENDEILFFHIGTIVDISQIVLQTSIGSQLRTYNLMSCTWALQLMLVRYHAVFIHRYATLLFSNITDTLTIHLPWFTIVHTTQFTPKWPLELACWREDLERNFEPFAYPHFCHAPLDDQLVVYNCLSSKTLIFGEEDRFFVMDIDKKVLAIHSFLLLYCLYT